MRISELSRASEVPVPTIKYYLREGLLPGGELALPNKARYDESHLRRLTLIRSLIDVGGLSIADVRAVVGVIDTPGRPIHEVLGATVSAITAAPPTGAGEERRSADRVIDELIARRDWRVGSNPARGVAADVLARLYQLGQHQDQEWLDTYARAAELIAETDLSAVAAVEGRDARAEIALVGTILGDALLAALRRLAQEHASAQRFPPQPGSPQE